MSTSGGPQPTLPTMPDLSPWNTKITTLRTEMQSLNDHGKSGEAYVIAMMFVLYIGNGRSSYFGAKEQVRNEFATDVTQALNYIASMHNTYATSAEQNGASSDAKSAADSSTPDSTNAGYAQSEATWLKGFLQDAVTAKILTGDEFETTMMSTVNDTLLEGDTSDPTQLAQDWTNDYNVPSDPSTTTDPGTTTKLQEFETGLSSTLSSVTGISSTNNAEMQWNNNLVNTLDSFFHTLSSQLINFLKSINTSMQSAGN